jgi:threonine-phosphate decarboxylase
LILRSLTKWLSIPGLRLGFIITSSKKMWDTLEGIRPPWNVNSLAECSISMLLSRYSENMRSFIERSRAYIDQEKRYLIDDLRKAGVPRIYRGEANYVLSWLGEHIDSIMLGLVKRGISLRDCSSFTGLGKGYVRISVRRREDNEELIGAMRSLLKGLMSSEEYS